MLLTYFYRSLNNASDSIKSLANIQHTTKKRSCDFLCINFLIHKVSGYNIIKYCSMILNDFCSAFRSVETDLLHYRAVNSLCLLLNLSKCRSYFKYNDSLWGYLIFYSKYIPWSLRKKIFLGIRDRRSQNLRKKISSFHQCSFLIVLKELIAVRCASLNGNLHKKVRNSQDAIAVHWNVNYPYSGRVASLLLVWDNNSCFILNSKIYKPAECLLDIMK